MYSATKDSDGNAFVLVTVKSLSKPETKRVYFLIRQTWQELQKTIGIYDMATLSWDRDACAFTFHDGVGLHILHLVDGPDAPVYKEDCVPIPKPKLSGRYAKSPIEWHYGKWCRMVRGKWKPITEKQTKDHRNEQVKRSKRHTRSRLSTTL